MSKSPRQHNELRSTGPSGPVDCWLSSGDAATIAGVSIQTIKNWIDGGALASAQTPGGHRRIRQSHLMAFLESAKPVRTITPKDSKVVGYLTTHGRLVSLRHKPADDALPVVLLSELTKAQQRIAELEAKIANPA